MECCLCPVDEERQKLGVDVQMINSVMTNLSENNEEVSDTPQNLRNKYVYCMSQ